VDPAQWLADYDRNLARTAANAQAAGDSLRHVGGKATSPRGEVEVTVGASGALEDLTLTPMARALEADELARLILDTARQAQRTVGAQVVEIMTHYLGDGPALDMVVQNLSPVAKVESTPPPVLDDDYYFANPPEITR
jgi:hypothetical protein